MEIPREEKRSKYGFIDSEKNDTDSREVMGWVLEKKQVFSSYIV